VAHSEFSESTVHSKWRVIEEALGVSSLDPRWTLSSLAESTCVDRREGSSILNVLLVALRLCGRVLRKYSRTISGASAWSSSAGNRAGHEKSRAAAAGQTPIPYQKLGLQGHPGQAYMCDVARELRSGCWKIRRKSSRALLDRDAHEAQSEHDFCRALTQNPYEF
jgi:hypothetical protein